MSIIGLVILLLVVGLALLAIEIFVIPGFGVIGILGIGCVVSGGGLAWVRLGARYGLLAALAGILVAAAMFWLFPRTSMGRKLVLNEAQRGMRAADPGLSKLVGKEGLAFTPLRPSGMARIEERTVDVVTDGVYIEAGKRIRVVEVAGARVQVEEIKSN